MSNKISAAEAKRELWRRGQLSSWMLDQNQKDLATLFHTSNHVVQTWLLARRSGKTYALLVLALEQCLKNPKSIVKFVAPTRLQLQTIVRPLLTQILETCPKEISPEFKTQDFIYYFPNGSELQLAGSESGHIEKLRGGFAQIAIIDEAQDVSDLENAVKSVLLPTILTTRGKILISGTPPKSLDHPFVKYIEEAELKGSLIRRTIYNNPRITKEDIELILNEYPLRERSEEFRREFLCELIKDQNTSVVPEFTPEIELQVIREWPRPPFFDGYVSMDLGAVDLTGLLFGYYDFRAGKVIIEDEIVMDFSEKDSTIKKLTELVTQKEEQLWFNPISGEVKRPYLRVSDINPIAVREIAVYSNNVVSFTNTKKDDKESAINNLRVLIGSGKVIINPRCVNLIRHLRNVKWSSVKNKKDFARSPDNGHYDLVDALIYFCRSIIFSKNPYPHGYDLGPGDKFFPHGINQSKNLSNRSIEAYKRIFGVKPQR